MSSRLVVFVGLQAAMLAGFAFAGLMQPLPPEPEVQHAHAQHAHAAHARDGTHDTHVDEHVHIQLRLHMHMRMRMCCALLMARCYACSFS